MDSPVRSRIVGPLAAANLDLDVLLTPLAPRDWRLPTSVPGWTVAHHVAHLTWGDHRALLAVQSPEEYLHEVGTRQAELPALIAVAATHGATWRPARVIGTWRAGHYRLARELSGSAVVARLKRTPFERGAMVAARLAEVRAHRAIVARAVGRAASRDLPPNDGDCCESCRTARFGCACPGCQSWTSWTAEVAG